ncbi:MAG: JAB domain-containing protein [Verrucomicrobiaceae bacterium]|nr:JAB domain-containing protein [Verrucomicrobiaceae bacterium]
MKSKTIKLSGLGCFRVEKVAEAPFLLPQTSRCLERYWRKVIAPSPFIHSDKENMVVVAFNRRMKAIGWHLVSIGDVCGVYCGAREVMRPLILCAASSFVLMHNHPSGDPSPSQPDREVTKNMRSVAKIMGIGFMDHIILGDGSRRYFSFHDHGLMDVDELAGKPLPRPAVPWAVEVRGVGKILMNPTFIATSE